MSQLVHSNAGAVGLTPGSQDPLEKEMGTQSSIFVVQSLSPLWLFVTPLTAAHQASLSFTMSQSLLKFMSIEAGDAIQPSHPLSPYSPFAFGLSQHQ